MLLMFIFFFFFTWALSSLRRVVQVFLTLSIWIFVYAKIYLVFDSRTASNLLVVAR